MQRCVAGWGPRSKGELTDLAVNSVWDKRKRGIRKGCKDWDDSLTEMGKVKRKAGCWVEKTRSGFGFGFNKGEFC